MSDYELVQEQRARNRNTKTLKDIYTRSMVGSGDKDRKERERWKEDASYIIDRVGSELLRHSKFEVMTLPCWLVANPYTNAVVPIVASTRMICAIDLDADGNFNRDEAVRYLLKHYFELLMDLPERVPTVISLYDLFVPCGVVVDPQSNQERIGIMTRYAKYHFEEPVVPPFNYDEGDE